MSITREFVENSARDLKVTSQDSLRLRVMTFNVLAQGLSSNSFIKCPPEALDYEKRLDGIVKEISSFSPDLVCLQEVDMHSQLTARLPEYMSYWSPKVSSPCLNVADNIGPDGSAILCKTSTLKILSQHTVTLQADGVPCNQILVAANVKLRNGHKVLLICLHLKAKKPFADLRQQQGLHTLDFFKSKQAECDSVIIAGDLNSEPEEPVHKLLESSGFESSYVAVTGKQPAYTTCKYRSVEGAEVKQCKVEDYIYAKNLSAKHKLIVDRILEVPPETALGEGRLPSMHYPSDHLSMVADYASIVEP
ncbi:nocturnin-like isoform X2 [Watersipora subatra]|uniref:nocturnin-like isoform X2 n=1 Tax=Watersipora subatra TaxID=2589382 RepID=UPI00355C6F01